MLRDEMARRLDAAFASPTSSRILFAQRNTTRASCFDGSFRQQLLFEEHYVGMVRRGHPTFRDSLSLETFLGAPQLVYQPTGGGHGFQESAVDQAVADVPRRVAVRAAHSMGVASIVSSTDLLVIVPSRLAAACRDLAEVSILPIPIEIPKFQVKQHWHERFHHDPGNRWLRGLVADLFQVRRTDAPSAESVQLPGPKVRAPTGK